MKLLNKKWILILLLILIGGLSLTLLRNGKPTPPEFTTAVVEAKDLMETISSTGTIEAKGTVEVGTQVSGTVAKVLADYNDKVNAGQVLVILDQSTLQASLDEAEAQKARAEAQLDKSKSEFDRAQKLKEQGHISEKDFTDARSAMLIDQASLKSAEASYRRARENFTNAIIKSPIRGTVLQRNIEVGQTVAASLSAPTLFIIAKDLSQLEIIAGVDESDISQIKVGQDVRFSVQAYPDSLFVGKVRQIRLQPENVQNVVTYSVVIDAGNPSGVLLPGMTATVDFILKKSEHALCVPSAALRFHPSFLPKPEKEKRKAIWIQKQDGHVEPRFVDTGIVDGNGIELLSPKGIKAGDKVVIGEKESNSDKKSTTKNQGFFGFGPPPGGRPPH